MYKTVSIMIMPWLIVSSLEWYEIKSQTMIFLSIFECSGAVCVWSCLLQLISSVLFTLIIFLKPFSVVLILYLFVYLFVDLFIYLFYLCIDLFNLMFICFTLGSFFIL